LILLSYFILSCHAFIFKKKPENLQLTSWSCLRQGVASRFDLTSVLPFHFQGKYIRENIIYKSNIFKEKGKEIPAKSERVN